MAKPSKGSVLASKIHEKLRECTDEYAPIELLSMQAILKEELSRPRLYDLLSAAFASCDRMVAVPTDKMQQ